MAELVLGPLIGGLAADRAHFWGRANGPGQLHAWLGHAADLSDAFLAGSSLPLRPENGFAGVAPVKGLRPNTHYRYALTFDKHPPSPALAPFPKFTTAPPEGQPTSFAFAFGSCFRPADRQGGGIFRALERLRQSERLRFLLMLGDQIYADAYRHNGIGNIAVSLEEYRAVYAYTFGRQALRELLQRIPVYMILDDHEVDDDWRWLDSGRRQAAIPWWDQFQRWLAGRPLQERQIPRQRVQDALQAYWEHQGMHAPAYLQPPPLDLAGQYVLQPGAGGSVAYTFNFGAAAFFVLDTRTMRVCNRQERSLLGEDQWQQLESWLLAVKDRFPVKFLVSSSALLYGFRADFARDRWSGFLVERERLLHFLAAHGIAGVYILTGDVHIAHAVRADLVGPGEPALPLWEFCSSPFEQKPTWLAHATYYPLRSATIRRQERVFSLAQPNFGLVRVNFNAQGQAGVRFEVYGAEGDLLATAGTETNW